MASIRSGLPFPPPADHILSELSIMIHPSLVVLHSMVHSFIELCKPLHHDKAVIHDGVDILECEVKWALESSAADKARL